MAATEITLLSGRLPMFADPEHTAVHSLDGSNYTFRFVYAWREDRWYFDLATEDGEVLVYGIKLVQGVSLLELLTDSRAPRGVLAVYPLVDGAGDPGLFDFVDGQTAATCGLFYAPISEFA